MFDVGLRLITPMLEKRWDFDEAMDYYEGTKGEFFFNERLRDDFRNKHWHSHYDRTTLNFMRPVVDNVNNRLELSNLVVKTKEATTAIEKIREENNMELLEKEIHRKALAMGESFALVWPNPISREAMISMHDPRSTIVLYDPDNPREKLVGARIWYDVINGGHKMNVFWPDTVDKYTTVSEEITAGTTWVLTETIVNPFGEVPLFHFRTHGQSGRPEHVDGYNIQDSITKLSTTHMSTVEYQGAPQRWALAHPDANGSEIEDFEENEPGREQEGLKNGPGELWYMRGFSSVGQFNPAPPEVFTAPIDHLVKALAALTNTPLHYFESTGNIPSGNALRAAEAPLLKKVADRQLAFGGTWEELYNFALRVALDKDIEVDVLWHSVESLDELERWDVIAKKINAGIPFRQAMIESGYNEVTIDQMIQWKLDEQATLGNTYSRATNTNPDVRTNLSANDTNVVQQDNVQNKNTN